MLKGPVDVDALHPVLPNTSRHLASSPIAGAGSSSTDAGQLQSGSGLAVDAATAAEVACWGQSASWLTETGAIRMSPVKCTPNVDVRSQGSIPA